ncbi:Hypothetical protein CINCED_3A025281 [Cinara cedri]|uniref:Uncharacterized protein n=1 Tax=Cinara cedri TaxID=506608 RepID=A0A5E4NLF8_9HEMI|nr:Hypothetical protein CINCED_3A025281 [Cinara cedri]
MEYVLKQWKRAQVIILIKPGRLPVQVHCITNVINKALEEKNNCYEVFLDVAQAFDKVWHKRLLINLCEQLPHNLTKKIKKIEFLTNNSSLNFEEKITKLLQIWENCCCKLQKNHCHDFETRIFTHYAISESTMLLFQREWEHIEQQIKNKFITIVVQIISFFEININSEVLKTLKHFINIINNPWDILPNFNAQKHTRMMELFTYILNKENGSIIVNRVKVLFHDQQLNLAFNLADMLVYLYEQYFIRRDNTNLFPEDDYECCRDILFSLLMYCDRKYITRIIENINPMDEGKRLIFKYYHRIKYLSTLVKEDLPINYPNIVRFCEMGATILINQSFQYKFQSMLQEFCELMRYWCDIVFLLEKFELFSNLSDPFYKQSILNFIEWAPSADHLFSMADIFYAKFGSSFSKPVYVKIYIRALSMTLDEMNYYKRNGPKQNALLSAKRCTQRYLKLADLFEDVLLVHRECVLTAFQIMPSKDLMDRIENLAIQSGILKSNHSKRTSSRQAKKNNTEVNRNNYDRDLFLSRRDCTTLIHSTLTNLQPELFNTSLINKLLNIVRAPRMECFHWDLPWLAIKIECEVFLTNLDQIINKNLLQRSDLGYTREFHGKYYDMMKIKKKAKVNEESIKTDSLEEIIKKFNKQTI